MHLRQNKEHGIVTEAWKSMVRGEKHQNSAWLGYKGRVGRAAV